PIDTAVALGLVPRGVAGGQPHGGAGVMSPCAACASSALAAPKSSWKLPFPVRWQIPLSTAYWSVPLEDVVPPPAGPERLEPPPAGTASPAVWGVGGAPGARKAGPPPDP